MNKPIDRYEFFNGAEWTRYADGKPVKVHFPNPSPGSDQMLITIRVGIGVLTADGQQGKELKMPLLYNGVDFDIASIQTGKSTIVISAGDNVLASATIVFRATEITDMKSGLFRILRTILLLYIIKVFFLSAGAVPIEQEYFQASSMSKTLNLGERFFYSKISYKLTAPKTGDLVAFLRDVDYEKLAKIEGVGKGKTARVLFVKRVIGVGGDQIQVLGKDIYLNGNLLSEDYATHGDSNMNIGPLAIPKGHVFVIGDNRPYSEDSRHWVTQSSGSFILEGFEEIGEYSDTGGFVPIEDIVGKPFLVFWPIGEFRLIR